MKIAMITGSYPPAVCGVGYYTQCLTDALRSAGEEVDVVVPASRRVSDTIGILRQIDALKPDITHIQYPTIGYGASLVPQLISLARSCVVTLHELSQAHILRKFSLFPFTLRSRHIIFTTSFEQSYAIRAAPWIMRRSSVIPIGSNLTVRHRATQPLCSTIIHFGIIRPNKGIEDVIRLAELIKRSSLELSISIIGKRYAGQEAYASALQQKTRNLPVRWHLELPDEEIEKLLGEACIAYQPYPDGASERRSSLITVLLANIAVVTTGGSHMPDDLAAAVLIAPDPRHALETIQGLLADHARRIDLTRKGASYASAFSWESIARKHLDVYRRAA